ncbi:MAG: hypothetical protein IIX53_02075 [Phascolarctobacterium sp.]|nr:hypothetical protein [Phascolarctobacterium sp.]MBQ5672851.1 hypothetical protein [Phascolarctobacterium sp.]
MTFIEDVKEISKTEAGKRVLKALLELTGAEEVRCYNDARYEAHQNGKRYVGMEILNAMASSREGLEVLYEWRLKKLESPKATVDEFYDNFL